MGFIDSIEGLSFNCIRLDDLYKYGIYICVKVDFDKGFLKDEISKLLDTLTDEEWLIINLEFYYGFKLEDICDHCGLSMEDIINIRNTSLRKMKERSGHLINYIQID